MTWRCQNCRRPHGGAGLTTTLDRRYRSGKCYGCKRTVLFVEKGEPALPAVRVPVARRTDPETSWAAAASVGHLRESQQLIYGVLRDIGPASDEQIWSAINSLNSTFRTSPSGARTRRSELVEMGLVRDSKQRVRMSTGRMAIVWEVTP